MEKAFYHFRFDGRELLGIDYPRNGGVTIIGADGANYGGWRSVESFKDFIKKHGWNNMSLGKAEIRFACL